MNLVVNVWYELEIASYIHSVSYCPLNSAVFVNIGVIFKQTSRHNYRRHYRDTLSASINVLRWRIRGMFKSLDCPLVSI